MSELQFAGNGDEDVSGSMPQETKTLGMQAGGPMECPKGADTGATASGDTYDSVGPDSVSGGQVQFAGNDW